jgi:hypothetical protein
MRPGEEDWEGYSVEVVNMFCFEVSCRYCEFMLYEIP